MARSRRGCSSASDPRCAPRRSSRRRAIASSGSSLSAWEPQAAQQVSDPRRRETDALLDQAELSHRDSRPQHWVMVNPYAAETMVDPEEPMDLMHRPPDLPRSADEIHVTTTLICVHLYALKLTE